MRVAQQSSTLQKCVHMHPEVKRKRIVATRRCSVITSARENCTFAHPIKSSDTFLYREKEREIAFALLGHGNFLPACNRLCVLHNRDESWRRRRRSPSGATWARVIFAYSSLRARAKVAWYDKTLVVALPSKHRRFFCASTHVRKNALAPAFCRRIVHCV